VGEKKRGKELARGKQGRVIIPGKKSHKGTFRHYKISREIQQKQGEEGEKTKQELSSLQGEYVEKGGGVSPTGKKLKGCCIA